MLDAYKKLEANGVIGRLMKVDPSGKPIIDPGGELPGRLVERPFSEYPKAVRRVKMHTDAETGKVTEEIVTLVAGSKSEELKIMSDTVEMDVPRSPLERERDELATELSTQQQMNGKLANQLESALTRLSELANKVEKLSAGAPPPPEVDTSVSQKQGTQSGIAALAEQRALNNKK
jgi:hypothetical protein